MMRIGRYSRGTYIEDQQLKVHIKEVHECTEDLVLRESHLVGLSYEYYVYKNFLDMLKNEGFFFKDTK